MSQDAAETARARAEDEVDSPKQVQASLASIPHDASSIMLIGIFVLLLFYTLYFAAEIVVPLIFAVMFKLLLQPGVRVLTKVHVPRAIAALVMICVLFGALGGFGYLVSGPAATWAARAPESLPRVTQRLSVLKKPLDLFLAATHQVEQMTQENAPGAAAPVAVKGPGISEYLFTSTRSLAAGIGITVLLLFFLLASGDLFMRKFVEILPTFSDKKQAVEASREIGHNVSAYLVTITIMNGLVGCATGLTMYAIGLPDAVLWGSLAFVLNYVLILGPMTGVVLFFLVGMLNFDSLLTALLPPACYLVIHVIEGEVVTPMLVARRFTLNPVLVILSLIFWDWMWGIPGALLAVPMLAGFKIICERVRPLMAVAHFIGG